MYTRFEIAKSVKWLSIRRMIWVRLPDETRIYLSVITSRNVPCRTSSSLPGLVSVDVVFLCVFIFPEWFQLKTQVLCFVLCCAQFPPELQAEGARQLPQREAGTARQFVRGSSCQIHPRHDSEAADSEPALEREVSIVSLSFVLPCPSILRGRRVYEKGVNPSNILKNES